MLSEMNSAAINLIRDNINGFIFTVAQEARRGCEIEWRARAYDGFHCAVKCRLKPAPASKTARLTAHQSRPYIESCAAGERPRKAFALYMPDAQQELDARWMREALAAAQ